MPTDMKAETRKAATAANGKKRRQKRTASAVRRRGGCQRLYRFAAGCGADAPGRLDALVRLARAGDCQFDRRCPRAGQCPVAAQTLYKPRRLMIRPVTLTAQRPPVTGDCTNWSDVWY